ncbi:hypothetical protein K9U39_04620 [Rhodoblastus acidophilus]|uniref:Uncharacterized protein n=1 Tax=Candidatus Rhodoblastus alkanivorans TaxID=2954117 RepID=A0ABS9Z684_9HYPH|nr:hypothetical protein [Candidatus Rhodoblastus alkanivorans]MCI4678402.1 hypothetical protein [Candidatus Rhodoblastus alkanivorans]MCI4682925.1 hypothetical protein [Candidatus Rhodoblastus alkanivorans]MDI4640235.1 hypothetical protein [Rhodoblastus acidophilus]
MVIGDSSRHALDRAGEFLRNEFSRTSRFWKQSQLGISFGGALFATKNEVRAARRIPVGVSASRGLPQGR